MSIRSGVRAAGSFGRLRSTPTRFPPCASATRGSPSPARQSERALRGGGVPLVATLSGEPLYRAFGFEPVERFDETSTGVAIPVLTMGKAIDVLSVRRGAAVALTGQGEGRSCVAPAMGP
jgi:hypothetical protein